MHIVFLCVIALAVATDGSSDAGAVNERTGGAQMEEVQVGQLSEDGAFAKTQNDHDATLLFVYAGYDGTSKQALPVLKEFCQSHLHASTYGCASVDVQNDPSVQQRSQLTGLPALIIRTTVEDKPLVHHHYGPWSTESLRKAVQSIAPRVCAVIPARFASTRFPHKMLRPIQGKPMIQLTYEQVQKAEKVDAVWIATEGEQLIQAASAFTNRVLKTSDKPINGMERIGEAEAQLPSSCRVLVNIHGDEPFVEPEHINKVVELYQQTLDGPSRRRSMGAASLRKQIKSEEEARNRGIIKMVVRDDGTAQYLSRALVPHSKDGAYDPNTEYWSHINLHAFPRGFASEYRAFPSPKAQLREDVEYLRILVMGYDIVTAVVGDSERDVNTDEDYNYLVQKYGK